MKVQVIPESLLFTLTLLEQNPELGKYLNTETGYYDCKNHPTPPNESLATLRDQVARDLCEFLINSPVAVKNPYRLNCWALVQLARLGYQVELDELYLPKSVQIKGGKLPLDCGEFTKEVNDVYKSILG